MAQAQKTIHTQVKNVKIEECCEVNSRNPLSHAPDCNFRVRSSRYADIKSTAVYIYRNEGLLAFTKGISPRMCINVPSTALSWGTYELIKSLLVGPANHKNRK